MGAPEIQIPITTLLVKEVDFKGSFRYGVSPSFRILRAPPPLISVLYASLCNQPGDYQLAIDLVAQGRIDLKPLVTHRYSFDQAVEAFQATRAGKSPDGKAVIKAVISGPDVDPADLL